MYFKKVISILKLLYMNSSLLIAQLHVPTHAHTYTHMNTLSLGK